MVSTSSFIMMLVDAILGFGVPVGLAWWLVKKYHVRLATILIGAGTFIVFALVLEAIVHQIVLNGDFGANIRDNVWLLAIYGGVMAGLFEETGRLVAMKFLLKKEPTERKTALAYGIGHGGVEMMFVLGVTMIVYLVMSVMINDGQTDMLLSKIPAENQEQFQAQLQQIQDYSVGIALLGFWERLSALVLHLGLSFFVFAAVRKGGRWLWLFPAAIFLHAVVDGCTVLLVKTVGMVPLELILSVVAVGVFALGLMVTKKMQETE